jgi:hypothetical protein
VPTWTDLDKTVFVTVINPIIFEAALTFCRFVARSLSEHHEAAGWVLLGCAHSRRSNLRPARAFATLRLAVARSECGPPSAGQTSSPSRTCTHG